MAGNNQHHVWQMLQRGFGEKRGKDHHVWVYSKTEPARQTATRLFGAEKHFYGPEGSLADLNITKYENENQSTIQEIRRLPNGADVDREFAANLIAHLELRSAFLREDASEKMQKAMTELLRQFTSPKELRAAMVNYLKGNPDKLDKFLGKEFIPVNQRAGFVEIIHRLIETLPEEKILEHFSADFFPINQFIKEFPSIMNASQNRILGENEDFPLRAKLHMQKQYSVLRPASGSFILPDTTLAFIKKEGASPFIDKNDNIESVVLPIAHDVAIIGRSGVNTNYPLKAINRILAGCSFKAFIAREQSLQWQGLTKRIGKYARLISDRDLNRIISSALLSHHKPS